MLNLKCIFTSGLMLLALPALSSGNDHGQGDPTLEPLEEIVPPGLGLAKDRLLEFARIQAKTANAILDAFEACKLYRSTKDHAEGFLAMIRVTRKGGCKIVYFDKFFKTALNEEAQAEVSVHEAVHYATRLDERFGAQEDDDEVQSMARKIMLRKWDELELLPVTWKVAEPEHSFFNLPLEELAQILKAEGALQMPKVARENQANEQTVTIRVVEFSGPVQAVCQKQVYETLAKYSNMSLLTIANGQGSIVTEVEDSDDLTNKMNYTVGEFDGEYFNYFFNEVLTDKTRGEAGGNVFGLKDGTYCQFDLFINPKIVETIGVQTLVIIPARKGKNGTQKAIVIRFDYVHA